MTGEELDAWALKECSWGRTKACGSRFELNDRLALLEKGRYLTSERKVTSVGLELVRKHLTHIGPHIDYSPIGGKT